MLGLDDAEAMGGVYAETDVSNAATDAHKWCLPLCTP